MITLVQANPYLRDPAARRRMLEASARQSSIFEGARLGPVALSAHGKASKARSSASLKKAARGA